MHGLINKSIQSFLRDNYGQALWVRVSQQIGVDPEGFEAMLHYDDALTEDLLGAATRVLDRPRGVLLEDIGAYLASIEELRRLLRFGGGDYWEFLFSLDELQGRSLMALPDLDFPELALEVEGGGQFRLFVFGPMPGWGAVMTGLLRAMADDYGALVLIEQDGGGESYERVSVTLLEAAFNEGRGFDLAQPLGAA